MSNCKQSMSMHKWEVPSVNGLFYHYLSFALTVLFSGALVLTILVFRKTGNRAYQLLSLFFAALLLAELFVRDVEIQGKLYTLLAQTFHDPSLPTALCYSLMSVVLAELARCCGGWNRHTLTVLCAVFFPLWFFGILLVNTQSTFLVWLYILPYQLYTLGLSLVLLQRQRRAGAPGDTRIQHLLILTAVFSVLILAEDTVVMLFPAAAAWRESSYRSLTENLLQALYALHAMRFSAQLLLQKEECSEPAAPLPTETDAVGEYARSISLSAREQDVLALLLEGKNNREISAALGLSQGTVKSYTHNIFQKSSTENREGVTNAFRRYTGGGAAAGTKEAERKEASLLQA